MGSRRQHGYGQVKSPWKNEKAHIVAYALSTSKAPDGAHVLHRCDNPPCCNPAHLWLGTHAENMRDMVAKARQSRPRGESSGRAKLIAENVREIRRRYDGGETQRGMAREFGVSPKAIRSLIQGKSWGHVS
jgi:hypothetical protein